MKKFIPLNSNFMSDLFSIMLMMAAPLTARADIIHTISASTQLRVDAAVQIIATRNWINIQCTSVWIILTAGTMGGLRHSL